MAMQRIFGLALALAVASGPALAADVTGRFAIKGVGQAACQDVVRASAGQPQDVAPFLHWLAGYLSAANLYEVQTFDLLAWQTDGVIFQSLISYCRDNPKTALALAAGKMVESLRQTRVQRAGGFQLLTINGQQIRFYDETMIRMKQILATAVGFRGPMDARWTPAVADALRRYQQLRRLPVTGLPDEATLVAMFAARPPR
jgi:hypothetical protein